MKITNQDLRQIIKEELEKVLDEDYSMLSDMTPSDALAYIEENLNGRTWVFWDLETIGFKGQITQYGAVAYKIDNIAGPALSSPTSVFEANVSLNDQTLEQSRREEELLSRAEDIISAGQEDSEEYRFITAWQKAQKYGRPHTVQDMLAYTHYSTSENDMEEKEALQSFVDWFAGLEGPLVSVGHNIKSFDRRRIIEEGQRLGVDTTAFEDIDIFDTISFQRNLFKLIAQELRHDHEKMSKFFYEYKDKISGELRHGFTSPLQRMIDNYGPGPDYVQLHTAVDDTEQLVTAFFNIYKEVKELVGADDNLGSMTGHINTKRANKEMGTDLQDPIEISKAISRFRRD
jgi:hypothetical protein